MCVVNSLVHFSIGLFIFFFLLLSRIWVPSVLGRMNSAKCISLQVIYPCFLSQFFFTCWWLSYYVETLVLFLYFCFCCLCLVSHPKNIIDKRLMSLFYLVRVLELQIFHLSLCHHLLILCGVRYWSSLLFVYSSIFSQYHLLRRLSLFCILCLLSKIYD